MTAQCATCGRDYERPTGRGRKSMLCDDCRTAVAKIRTTVRQFTVMSASMIEVAQMMGPALTKLREEVSEGQGGRCFTCARRRRRLFLRQAGETFVGQCIECFMKENYRDD